MTRVFCPEPAIYPVTVNPNPETLVITVNEDDFILISNAPNGNQWYFNGAPIQGATGQSHQLGY